MFVMRSVLLSAAVWFMLGFAGLARAEEQKDPAQPAAEQKTDCLLYTSPSPRDS